jgi:hypothetical protein
MRKLTLAQKFMSNFAGTLLGSPSTDHNPLLINSGRIQFPPAAEFPISGERRRLPPVN